VHQPPRTALVTGCSSGIGRATAILLRDNGFEVYASARETATLRELAATGIVPVRLDVTDEESMLGALDRVAAERGTLGVLVNAAGFELAGPFEETPLTDVGRQFEVNVLGLVRLTQLALPLLRDHGGRIVNVSSVFGRFAVPGNAFYAASKHAVTGLTEALRRELVPFGVAAILVEPTATRTRLHHNMIVAGAAAPGAPYRRLRESVSRWHTDTYAEPAGNVAGRFALDPDAVARVIIRAVTARRPRARYPVGLLAHGLFALRRWLPGPAFDAFVRGQFPVP
jgi:NAD(P)-dependent dehydrogenase (short-subunit alcohol dehydrogenase family)